MDVRNAYKTLLKASGFKVGDKVKVLRKFESRELGCMCSWHTEKEKSIGQTGKITCTTFGGDIGVRFGSNPRSWVFPFFVLELVESVKETHTITIDGKSTEVSED